LVRQPEQKYGALKVRVLGWWLNQIVGSAILCRMTNKVVSLVAQLAVAMEESNCTGIIAITDGEQLAAALPPEDMFELVLGAILNQNHHLKEPVQNAVDYFEASIEKADEGSDEG